MKQGLMKATTEAAAPLNLNLNLRMFGFAGLIVTIYYAFAGRGLYFKPELLPGLMMITVVFLFALGDAVIRGETDFYRFPADYLVTAVALVYLLAVFGAVSKPDAAVGALKYAGYLLVFCTTAQVVKSWQGYRRLLEFIYAGALMVALIGLFSATGHLKYPGAYNEKSILSTFQYQNALAIFLAVAFIITLSLWAAAERSPLKELWYIGGALLLNITLLGTQSRAVWMMFPVLLLVWIMGLPKERRLRNFFGIAYVLMASVLISRGFYSRAEAGWGAQALTLLLGGGLMSLAGWLVMHRANRLIRRKPMGTAVRKFWQGLGVVYVVAVLLVYAAYTVKSLPGGWDEVVPAAVTQQMGTVTGYDSSFQARIMFYRDALLIVKDYPLTGTGAGGWNALYHKYQSAPYIAAELHNGFLQVLVETGIVGFLVYTALWGVSFYSAYRLFRHFRKDRQWPLVWGVTVSLLAIALHSAFDFDLSLPTLCILTWMLFGLLRNGRQLARKKGEEIPLVGNRRWPVLIMGTALALAVLLPAYRLYGAGQTGAEGAQAMAAGDVGRAEEKMRSAAVQDPYSGSFPADLARINLVYWLKDGDPERLKQGILLAEQAVQKEPHNLQLKTNLITAYLTAGMNSEAAAEAERLAAANPFEIKAYEVLAGAGVDAAMYYKQKGELTKALIYLNKVDRLPAELNKKREQAVQASGKAYRYGWVLTPTPQLNLSFGQSCLLAGRTAEGIPYLETAAGDKKAGREAAAWLAAAYKAAGDAGKAAQLIAVRSGNDKDFKLLYDQVEKILQK